MDELTPDNDDTISHNLFFGEKLGESAYFFDFPSPLFEYVDIDTLFLQDHFPYQERLNSGGFTVENNVFNFQDGSRVQDSTKTSTCNVTPRPNGKNTARKKSSKERHSKINTAQGPRDRRMRLSVEVAGKFFALQDMLGFDKASKTIEWLLIQANDEVEKLARESAHLNSCGATAKSAFSTNESNVNGNCAEVKNKGLRPGKLASKNVQRESREKARARARERTKLKMQNQSHGGRENDEGNVRLDLSNNSSLVAGNKKVAAQRSSTNLVEVEEPDSVEERWT